ncbi:MAG: tRNA (adenosine(37)-N6)-threonylcarbamoyltransferase complex transferase subunit TsaD [Gammaproteobacteria bacterium RIFCSPHIGHO2_12_FULL_45_9]|nr:MAG: tRNA (adenosine(37)-N6)-threonylcarbamoyltransferase complex transferase subunit TsaD [Gammaproteobacteria bacterium RIFCSPHIGHO2_12_FULL_45_9]
MYSQIAVHAPHGGVVPELASRDHAIRLLPMVSELLSNAKWDPTTLSGVAFTRGPGLIGALMVGATIGRTLAYMWNIPAIGVHHLEAHLLVVCLEDPAPAFPFLALLVSGGHTLLIEVSGVGHYRVVGESLDDAAGEAFDKTAKLLGLPYPGGAALSRLAEQGRPDRVVFPRPRLHAPDCDFSFSGLKTAVNQYWKQLCAEGIPTAQDKADIALAFEQAVIDVLVAKVKRALADTGLSRVVLAGGVSANQRLRGVMRHAIVAEVFYPRLEWCTDNGAMVAYAGYLRLSRGAMPEPLGIRAEARWPLEAC